MESNWVNGRDVFGWDCDYSEEFYQLLVEMMEVVNWYIDGEVDFTGKMALGNVLEKKYDNMTLSLGWAVLRLKKFTTNHPPKGSTYLTPEGKDALAKIKVKIKES